MKADQLYGQWAVRFDHPPAGLPARATVRLQRHAEFSESLAGTVSRDLGAAAGTPAAVADFAEADADTVAHHQRAQALMAKEGIGYEEAARRTAI